MTSFNFCPFREIFTTPDEGELALDWYDTDYNDSNIKEDAPILLILPGLTCKLMISCANNLMYQKVDSSNTKSYRP